MDWLGIFMFMAGRKNWLNWLLFLGWADGLKLSWLIALALTNGQSTWKLLGISIHLLDFSAVSVSVSFLYCLAKSGLESAVLHGFWSFLEDAVQKLGFFAQCCGLWFIASHKIPSCPYSHQTAGSSHPLYWSLISSAWWGWPTLSLSIPSREVVKALDWCLISTKG